MKLNLHELAYLKTFYTSLAWCQINGTLESKMKSLRQSLQNLKSQSLEINQTIIRKNKDNSNQPYRAQEGEENASQEFIMCPVNGENPRRLI